MDKVALYGLEVPCGDVLVPAVPDFPATVSLRKISAEALLHDKFPAFWFLGAKRASTDKN